MSDLLALTAAAVAAFILGRTMGYYHGLGKVSFYAL